MHEILVTLGRKYDPKSPSSALIKHICPQLCAQLCINRLDVCLLNNSKRVKTDPQWRHGEAHDVATTPLSDRATAPTLSHAQNLADHRNHHAPHPAMRVCASARGRGPGRSEQHMSSENYRNNFRALRPIMNGARIIDEPRPTLKPPITSVTQWTPRYRRVTQINTMNVSAAAHSR